MTEKAPQPPRALGSGARQSRDALGKVALRSLPRPSALDAGFQTLPGVGPQTARTGAKLGIITLADLLEHLPFDHRDYERSRRVGELAIGEEATIAVSVRSCRVRPTRRRRLKLIECEVADDSGPVKAVWFNQEYLIDQLKEGTRVLLRGKLEKGRGGPAFRVREHEVASPSGEGEGHHAKGL